MICEIKKLQWNEERIPLQFFNFDVEVQKLFSRPGPPVIFDLNVILFARFFFHLPDGHKSGGGDPEKYSRPGT